MIQLRALIRSLCDETNGEVNRPAQMLSTTVDVGTLSDLLSHITPHHVRVGPLLHGAFDINKAWLIAECRVRYDGSNSLYV